MAKDVSARGQIAPYGSWRSPITAELIVAGSVGLSQIRLDGDDLYWMEQRPSEAGRNVIVRRRPNGRVEDITPPDFNARTRVHEYGGGAYALHQGTVWFTNFKDQRLYRQDPGGAPKPITPAKDIRHADCVVDATGGGLYAVREDHTTGAPQAVNSIVSVNAATGEARTLVSGNDFYAAPRLSPSGKQLCWLTWNHPNMPWDGTELWLAELADDGSLHDARRIAGGEEDSIFQPDFSPDGFLYFLSDRTGWWNLYRWRDAHVEPITDLEAELGVPLWSLGYATYAFASNHRILCQVRSKGTGRLVTIDPNSRRLTEVPTRFTAFGQSIQARDSWAYTIAGSPTEPPALVALDLDSGRVEVLRRSANLPINAAYISIPEAIEFPTEGGVTAHAFFYPPHHPEYAPPAGELPPLIVYVHGGPTSAVGNALDLQDQYWTSRGFAWVVVNYGGSTGYGREYRQRLNGQWGVVDVQDSVNAARYLIDRGLVDPNRVAITGGSAGGYTVLRALTTTDFFKAGASHYGISEMDAFHGDTHKFESRYDERLIGRWPEDRATYRERSALYSVDRIRAPLILFQGLEDEIVPPNQAELMVEALRREGLAVAYLPFEGEQHGFRMAKNIKRALEAELYFYSRVFGFPLADSIEPVPIENLKSGAAPARN
jgi:dipeptidyl aminopeptidase/acylaminoacyl peptidase